MKKTGRSTRLISVILLFCLLLSFILSTCGSFTFKLVDVAKDEQTTDHNHQHETESHQRKNDLIDKSNEIKGVENFEHNFYGARFRSG